VKSTPATERFQHLDEAMKLLEEEDAKEFSMGDQVRLMSLFREDDGLLGIYTSTCNAALHVAWVCECLNNRDIPTSTM
jgi:hypothetical protein